MEKNNMLRIGDKKITVRRYNFNGIELILFLELIMAFLMVIENWWFVFLIPVTAYIIIYRILCQFSFNAFEELEMLDDKIILRRFYLPFFINFKTNVVCNSENLHIFYENSVEIKAPSLLYHLFPQLFRKYSPGLTAWRGTLPFAFSPNKCQSMHFKAEGKVYSFGTMMSRESYDEILALILAQRAKWEKEHPEDATGHAPEDSETHTVDSPSQ